MVLLDQEENPAGRGMQITICAVRCRRGQLHLGSPDTYPCRAARLSRVVWGVIRLWLAFHHRRGSG